MSVSGRQKTAVTLAAIVAAGLLGYALTRGEATQSGDAGAGQSAGTVTQVPTTPVDVVDLSTPAQAAIATSTRLFDTSTVAVLSGPAADDRARAIAAATELQVPVLLDDAAAPAELTRLRATRVLTFGTGRTVLGGEAANGDPAALARQLRSLRPTATPPVATDALVVMASATDFDLAAANAETAGATVVQSSATDPRTDPALAAALNRRPGSAVIALGPPFDATLTYTADAVREQATQIGGGYLALDGRMFVALLRDPDQAGNPDSIALVKRTAARYATSSGEKAQPMLSIVATDTSVAELTPLVDAAQRAGLYVSLDLQPGDTPLLEQAQGYEDLLTRKNVGLSLEPSRGRAPVTSVEVNAVGAWLAELTAENTLPQKLMIVRQQTVNDLQDLDDLDTTRPELAVVLNVDKTGDTPTKLAAWARARSGAPPGLAFGWVQDFDDRPKLTVDGTKKQVLPYPDVVTYQ